MKMKMVGGGGATRRWKDGTRARQPLVVLSDPGRLGCPPLCHVAPPERVKQGGLCKATLEAPQVPLQPRHLRLRRGFGVSLFLGKHPQVFVKQRGSDGSNSLRWLFLRPVQPLIVANTLLLLLHRQSAPSPLGCSDPASLPSWLFIPFSTKLAHLGPQDLCTRCSSCLAGPFHL